MVKMSPGFKSRYEELNIRPSASGNANCNGSMIFRIGMMMPDGRMLAPAQAANMPRRPRRVMIDGESDTNYPSGDE